MTIKTLLLYSLLFVCSQRFLQNKLFEGQSSGAESGRGKVRSPKGVRFEIRMQLAAYDCDETVLELDVEQAVAVLALVRAHLLAQI